MSDSVLLVDFENVGTIKLDAIPAGVRVPFFFGASQKSVSKEFLKCALSLGERFEPIDIAGRGKNALDFHIAFYLGEHLTRSPASRCVVLSKDKGFDPLIKYLVERGFAVRRAMTLGEAFPRPKPIVTAMAAAKQQSSDQWELALQWLAGMQKNKRPRKRKGLVAHLHNHFAKKIPEADIEQFVERMIANKQLTHTGGVIMYHF